MRTVAAIALLGQAAAMNPVRRVVTLLQNMQTKVQEEGEKDQELFDQFMCYCKNNKGELEKTVEAGQEKVESLGNEIKASAGAHAQVQAELKQHKADREEAKEAIAKQTALREKEAAAFAKDSGDLQANIAAMNKAIPALEKGMGASFLQTTDAKLITDSVERYASTLDRVDLENMQAFLQGNSEYSPASGEIVGILKQMKEGMEKDLAEITETEDKATEMSNSLVGTKQKEISAASNAIEKKTARIGNAAVELVNLKNDLRETKRTVAEDQKFLASLATDCGTRGGEFDARTKMRNEELMALADTIKILNDDDALDLFKKAAPKPETSFIQMTMSAKQMKSDAVRILREAARDHPHALQFNFIALALHGKKVGFEKVLKMIDDMVAILKAEQVEDEKKKEYCGKELDKTADQLKDLKRNMNGLSTTVQEGQDNMEQMGEEIASLKAGITDLDKAVKDATAARKEENAQFTAEAANSNAAVQLLDIAKNRLNKFYNPALYKPPPQQELSEEDRVYQAMGGELEPTPAPGGIAGTGVTAFVQVAAHDFAAPPPPPPAGSYEKKSGQSTGVIGMIDTLVNDIKKESAEAKHEEETSQKDYEELLKDSASKRAADSKSITEKTGAKADLEEQVQKAKDERKSALEDFDATRQVQAQLHSECDWLVENFDARKDARAEEGDSLQKAKAVLSGADFSFLQKGTILKRRV